MHGHGVITRINKNSKVEIHATFYEDSMEGFGKSHCPSTDSRIGFFTGGDMDGTIAEFRDGLPYGKMVKNDM